MRLIPSEVPTTIMSGGRGPCGNPILASCGEPGFQSAQAHSDKRSQGNLHRCKCRTRSSAGAVSLRTRLPISYRGVLRCI
jgi:hypothetical protein